MRISQGSSGGSAASGHGISCGCREQMLRWGQSRVAHPSLHTFSLHPAEIMPSTGTTNPRQPSWWRQQPLCHPHLTAPGASKGHSTFLHPERPQRLRPLASAHPLLPTCVGRKKRRDYGSCLQAHNLLQGSIIQA